MSGLLPGAWTPALLEPLRQVSDPDADAVVQAHFAAHAGDGPGRLFQALAFQQEPWATPADPVASFLAHRPPPPPWLRLDAVERAQTWFGLVGVHFMCALYAGSLPTAYACHQGVQVLWETARLETDTKRRLNETAQFLMDVNRPGGLGPGAPGYQAVRRVRLMHAAVRCLILNEPAVTWDGAAWGVPLNQEDLLLTLLTFTEVAFEVFDRTGITYTEQQAEDYIHMWSMVGYLLGIGPDLLPLDRAATKVLMQHVRDVHFGPSEAGRQLMAALLDQARSLLPGPFRGLPASTVRWYIGDGAADMIGVPPADWTRVVFAPMAGITRVTSTERAHRKLLVGLSERFGRGMLTLAVSAERGGDRASFAIPEELAGPLGVGAKAGRRASAGRPSQPSGPG